MNAATKTKTAKAIKTAHAALKTMAGEPVNGDAWHVDNVTLSLTQLQAATTNREAVRLSAELTNAVDFALDA